MLKGYIFPYDKDSNFIFHRKQFNNCLVILNCYFFYFKIRI